MKLLLPTIHERDAVVGKKPSERLQAETAAPQQGLRALVGVTTGQTSGTGKIYPIYPLPSPASSSVGAEKGFASASPCCTLWDGSERSDW